jgi:hypothetical protein
MALVNWMAPKPSRLHCQGHGAEYEHRERC